MPWKRLLKFFLSSISSKGKTSAQLILDSKIFPCFLVTDIPYFRKIISLWSYLDSEKIRKCDARKKKKYIYIYFILCVGLEKNENLYNIIIIFFYFFLYFRWEHSWEEAFYYECGKFFFWYFLSNQTNKMWLSFSYILYFSHIFSLSDNLHRYLNFFLFLYINFI